jgi:hypothetical protein
MYRDYRRETGQAQYTQQLVKNVVDIATQYSAVSQAIIEATNSATRTANKTHKLIIKLMKANDVKPTEEHPSPYDDSESDIHPTAQPTVILDPRIADLHLNLIPQELSYETTKATKAKR